MSSNFNANSISQQSTLNNLSNCQYSSNVQQNTNYNQRQMNCEYGSFSFRKMFKPSFAYINAKNESDNKDGQSIKKIYDPCTSGSISQVSGNFGIENTIKKREIDLKTLSSFQLTSSKPNDKKNLSLLTSINDINNSGNVNCNKNINNSLNNDLFNNKKINFNYIVEDKENVNSLNIQGNINNNNNNIQNNIDNKAIDEKINQNSGLNLLKKITLGYNFDNMKINNNNNNFNTNNNFNNNTQLIINTNNNCINNNNINKNDNNNNINNNNNNSNNNINNSNNINNICNSNNNTVNNMNNINSVNRNINYSNKISNINSFSSSAKCIFAFNSNNNKCNPNSNNSKGSSYDFLKPEPVQKKNDILMNIQINESNYSYRPFSTNRKNLEEDKLFSGRNNSIYKHNQKLMLNHKRNGGKLCIDEEECSNSVNSSFIGIQNSSMRNTTKTNKTLKNQKKGYYDTTKHSKFSLSMKRLDKELDILTEKLKEMSFKKGLTETHEYFENGKTISLQEENDYADMDGKYDKLNSKRLSRPPHFIAMGKFDTIENCFPNLAKNNSKAKSPRLDKNDKFNDKNDSEKFEKFDRKIPKNYNIRKRAVNLMSFEEVVEQAKKEKIQILEITKQKKLKQMKNWKKIHRK